MPDTEEACRQAGGAPRPGVAGWAQGHLGPCPSSPPLAMTLSQLLSPSEPQFPHLRQEGKRGYHLIKTPGTDPQPPRYLSLPFTTKQEPGTPWSERGGQSVGRDIPTSPSSSGDLRGERSRGPLPGSTTVPHLQAQLSNKVLGNPYQL